MSAFTERRRPRLDLRALRCYETELQLVRGTYTMSGGRAYNSLLSTIVAVEYEDGMVGYGEACTNGSNYIDGCPGSAQAAVAELAPIVLGTDPFQPDVLLHRIEGALRGHPAAKAAIDAALHDLRGKLLGLPVCDLLGGRHQDSYPLFHPVALGDRDAMTEEAATFAADGYRRWQVKAGADPKEDAGKTRAVMETIGDRNDYLAVDANQGWSVAAALRFALAVDGIDLHLEQPCQTMREVASLRKGSRLPIILDESICSTGDLLRAIELGCVEAINIKPARVGGLTRAARLRDLAQDMGIMIIVDDAMGGQLATAGIAHLAASSSPDRFLAAAHPTAALIASSGTSGGAEIRGGSAAAPIGPGLGVDVDEEALGVLLFAAAGGTNERIRVGR